MLIMKCPECHKFISSALLAEIPSIVCEHCGAEVPVRNVLVTSNGFTFDRNDLLKRFFRYRKLLDEVIDERNALLSNPNVRKESQRSIEQFMTILQGMMAGARDNFRCQFTSPVSVRISVQGKSYRGFLQNLSMSGGCVTLPANDTLPRVNSVLKMRFFLPHTDTEILVSGEVCWAEKAKKAGQEHRLGIQFEELQDEMQTRLWEYIQKAASTMPH